MKYQITFQVSGNGKVTRFARYRTVESLKEAWDEADKIKEEYNKKHKNQCKVIGVRKDR